MEGSHGFRRLKEKWKSVKLFSRSAKPGQTPVAPSRGLTVQKRAHHSLSAPDSVALNSPSVPLIPATSTAIENSASMPASSEDVGLAETASATQPSAFPTTIQANGMTPSEPEPRSAETHTRPSQHPTALASTSTETPSTHSPEEASFPPFTDPKSLVQTLQSPSQIPAPWVNQEVATTGVPAGATDSTTMSPPKAGKFLEALTTLEEKHLDDYNRLEDGWKAYQDDKAMQTIDMSQMKLPLSVLNQPQSRELINRIKRHLPVIATAKHTVMTVASLDPHKIAPICCAVLFASAELTLNIADPELMNKTVEVFFEATNTIQEWVSFETNYVRLRPMQDKVAMIESKLPNLYLKALLLIANIERSVARKGINKRLNVLRNDPARWEQEVRSLKSLRSNLSIERKLIDEKVAAQEDFRKYLQWIKKDDDPEQTLGEIEEYVNPQRYEQYAEWFLSSAAFVAWSEAFQDVEHCGTSKRALWISGPYGTGKTTIVHRTLSALKGLEEAQPLGEALRVIPYFCTARGADEKRPNYETVIRSLAHKLSWMPDLSVDRSAIELYNYWNLPGQENPSIKDWEGILDFLLSKSRKLAIIVDGLDAFLTTEDGERFLRRMRAIMKKFPHVFFLCSSHRHVHVDKIFGDGLDEHKVHPEETKSDMISFINEEVSASKAEQGSDSIFFKNAHKDLLEAMKETLRGHAKGMFIWVKVWLAILLPRDNHRLIITGRKRAMDLLQEMKTTSLPNEQPAEQLRIAYQRLWKENTYPEHRKTRIHLFHLVLGSHHNMTITALTEALRVSSGDDDRDHENLTEERVESLGDDFLVQDSAGKLIFVHDSAKEFVLKMKVRDVDNNEQSDALIFGTRRNLLYVAELYITVAGQQKHPLWRESSIYIDLYRYALHIWPFWDVIYYREHFYDAQYPRSLLERYIGFRPPPQSRVLGQSNLENLERRLSQYTPIPCQGSKRALPEEESSRVFCPNLPLAAWLSALSSYRNGFLRYIVSMGLRYCALTVAKVSIFDAVWVELFDQVFRPKNPTHLVAIIEYFQFDPETTRRLFLRQDYSSRTPYAPIVAILNVIDCDDFPEVELGSLKSKPPSNWSDRERRLALLLQADPITSDEDLARAMYELCCHRTEACVKLVLSGIYHLRGPQAVLGVLIMAGKYSWTIFALHEAIHYDWPKENGAIVELLLEFELALVKQINGEKHVGKEPRNPPGPQWLWSYQGNQALRQAIWKLEEDTVCRLIDIFPPQDVDIQDNDKATVLHAAVDRGFLRVVQKLVIEFGARTDVKDVDGETALDYARQYQEHACVEYLESVE